MTLVAGVDSSTQSCKVVVRDLDTGELVREGRARHPDGTAVDPTAWWDALLSAVEDAGGLDDVAAIAVGAQQHGCVTLDADGEVVRDAQLWNDTSSAPQVEALNEELGAEEWVRRTGLSLVPSFTVTKVRWIRDNEPDNAERVAAVCLPHDYLTWRLRGFGPGNADLDALTTDRSDASGTGYWSAADEDYLPDLFELALGHGAVLPRVLGPRERAGETAEGIPGIPAGLPVGVGGGDNAVSALALGLEPGDAALSIGTSGTVFARTTTAVHDTSGAVAGFADATGDHLPLVATLNAARDMDAAARVLGVSIEEVGELALRAEPGAGGLTLLPFFEGERTPNLPGARASLHGMSLQNFTRENLARATAEGMIASLVYGIEAVRRLDVPIERILVIGGGARGAAVRGILPQVVDVPVLIPTPGEYVADGAARQAAAALTGDFPAWSVESEEVAAREQRPVIYEQHTAAKKALGYPV